MQNFKNKNTQVTEFYVWSWVYFFWNTTIHVIDLNICRKDQNSVNIYAVTIGKENGGTRDQNPRWMERRAANHT